MATMLAFDFGASSGRAILGEINNSILKIKEIHRFNNDPVIFSNKFQWDILRLIYEIKQGILKTSHNNDSDIESIGIDTWGVDFGLIDKNGNLINNPVHYRDDRTNGMMEKCFDVINKQNLYKQTGIFFAQYNSIYQLLSLKLSDAWELTIADKLLLMPDLIGYMLTGKKVAEYTNVTTSQLYSYSKNNWDYQIIDTLGFPKKIFPDIIMPGNIIGYVNEDLSKELGISKIPVIAVASHDTASAIAAVPAEDNDFIYISTGTWIMVGMESDKPILSDDALNYNFTNEGGVDGKIDFHKNIMGLWIIQECKRQWEREGKSISFNEMTTQAKKIESDSLIDPDDQSFFSPGDMPERVKLFCKNTNQKVPQTIGEIVRCIEDSVAFKCRYNIESIEKITNKKTKIIHMFGGGIQDELLCQLVANYSGKNVITGPIEATAIGNILLQGIALGYIKNIKEGRKIVKNSFEIKEFISKKDDNINKQYEKFLKILK